MFPQIIYPGKSIHSSLELKVNGEFCERSENRKKILELTETFLEKEKFNWKEAGSSFFMIEYWKFSGPTFGEKLITIKLLILPSKSAFIPFDPEPIF